MTRTIVFLLLVLGLLGAVGCGDAGTDAGTDAGADTDADADAANTLTLLCASIEHRELVTFFSILTIYGYNVTMKPLWLIQQNVTKNCIDLE